MLLDLLFSLTSASFHDPREQESVIGWRADCFDGCTACGAANLRPVAISQGRGGGIVVNLFYWVKISNHVYLSEKIK